MSPDAETDWARHPPYQRPGEPYFKKKIHGSCHCGQIEYWLSKDKPLAAKYCHCSDCRKIHGAPFQWAAIFEKTDLAFEKGTDGLKFYKTSSKETKHDLPCKVGCAHCGSWIMDEGRNMVLLFPTLLNLKSEEQRGNFQAQCHLFYPQRVVDLPDGKVKWTGLDGKSEKMDEP